MNSIRKVIAALLFLLLFLLPSRSIGHAQSETIITFNNLSNSTVCSVKISTPQSEDSVELWIDLFVSEDNFLIEQLEPGNTAEGSIEPGVYSVQVKDCDDTTMYFQTVVIDGNKTIDIKSLDSNLVITNNSLSEICEIKLSYAENLYLSGDWLEDVTMSPGSSLTIPLPKGDYSVVVSACKFKTGTLSTAINTVILQKRISVNGIVEISVPINDSVVKVLNYSESPICGVYISEDNEAYNRLSYDTVPVIWGGFSREYELVKGSYNLWLTDCQGEIIYVQQDSPIDGQKEVEILGEKSDYYKAFNQAWSLYILDDDLKGGLEKFEVALPLAKENNDIEAQENVLLYLADISEKLGLYDKALSYYNDIILLQKSRNSAQYEFTYLQKVAKIQTVLAQYDEAINGLDSFIMYSKAINDKQNEAAGYLLLGDIYFAKGEYDRAWLIYQKANAMDELPAEASLRLGKLWKEHGYPRESLNQLLLANELVDVSYDDNLQPEIFKQIGIVYMDLGMNEKAAEYLIMAMTILSENNEQAEMYSTSLYLGKVLIKAGEIDQAWDIFNQVLGYFRGSNYKVATCETLMEIGKISLSEENYEAAAKYFSEANQIAEENGFKQYRAQSLFYLGQIEYHQQGYNAALVYYQESYELFREIGTKKYYPELLAAEGKTYVAIGKNDDAVKAYMEAIDNINYFSQFMVPVDVKLSYTTEFENTFEDLAKLLILDGKYQDAYRYLEMNKSRSLRDVALGSEYGYGAVDHDIFMDAMLDTFQSQRAYIYGLRRNIFELSKTGGNQNQDQLKSELSFALNRQQEQLRQISIRYSSLGETNATAGLTLENVQSLLKENTVLVEYFILENNILIYVIEKSDSSAFQVHIAQDELVELVKGSRKRNGEQDKYLQTLYSQLITPVEDKLKYKNVIFVPQGELFYVPFAALTNGREYLIDKFQISLLPSANLLSIVFRDKNAKGNKALFFGDPEIQEPFLPVLVYSRDEVEEISDIYRTEPIIGDDATELLFTEMVGQARIVHMASHTLLYPEYPSLTSVLLSVDKENGWETVELLSEDDDFFTNEDVFGRSITMPIHQNDGYLEVYEIYSLDLENTELIVLSGCQTAFGDESRGDEVIGLSGAFLGKNVPTIISSLWFVNDEATSYLMQKFYKRLQSGSQAADALRLAQIETKEKYTDPYFWAGFILMGNGDLEIDIKDASLPINSNKENNIWMPYIVGVILVVSFFVPIIYLIRKNKKKFKVNKGI